MANASLKWDKHVSEILKNIPGKGLKNEEDEEEEEEEDGRLPQIHH